MAYTEGMITNEINDKNPSIRVSGNNGNKKINILKIIKRIKPTTKSIKGALTPSLWLLSLSSIHDLINLSTL